MPSTLSRRSFFAAGGSGLTLLLAACSTGPADGGTTGSARVGAPVTGITSVGGSSGVA